MNRYLIVFVFSFLLCPFTTEVGCASDTSLNDEKTRQHVHSVEAWSIISSHIPLHPRLQLMSTCKSFFEQIKCDLDSDSIFSIESYIPVIYQKLGNDLQLQYPHAQISEEWLRKKRSQGHVFFEWTGCKDLYDECVAKDGKRIKLLGQRHAFKSCSIRFDRAPFSPEEIFNWIEGSPVTSLNLCTGFSDDANDPLDDSIDITELLSPYLQKTKTLERLTLNGTSFVQKKFLSTLAHTTTVRHLTLHLDLCEFNVAPALVKHFVKSLRRNTTLLSLDMSNNDFTASDVAMVVEKNQTLQKLVMKTDERSEFKDKDIGIIFKALQVNTALQFLDLSNHRFTDAILLPIGLALKDRQTLLKIILHNNLFSQSDSITLNDGKLRIKYSNRYDDESEE